MRDRGRNAYVGYDTSVAPFLYRRDPPKDIEPMARVVVVRPILGKPKAVTLELLRAGTPLEDKPAATGEKYLSPGGWTPGKHRRKGT